MACAIVSEQYIGRFYVPVNDVVLVKILKSKQYLLCVIPHDVFSELVVLVVLLETACANILQKHIQVVATFMRAKILDNVLVLQTIEQLNLLF